VAYESLSRARTQTEEVREQSGGSKETGPEETRKETGETYEKL